MRKEEFTWAGASYWVWYKQPMCRCITTPIYFDETETPTAPVEAPPTETPKEEEKKSALDEAEEDAEPKDENGGSKPPEDGLCRECKRRRHLNRLKLCYPCFVDLVIMDETKKRGIEWKSGDKHPDFCACEGLGEHPGRDHGAWRGN